MPTLSTLFCDPYLPKEYFENVDFENPSQNQTTFKKSERWPLTPFLPAYAVLAGENDDNSGRLLTLPYLLFCYYLLETWCKILKMEWIQVCLPIKKPAAVCKTMHWNVNYQTCIMHL